MRGRTSNPTFSIPRDLKRRASYFLFCVIFLCSAVNFMLIILPKVFRPIENMGINRASCVKKNQSNQSIQMENDEFGHIKNLYEHDNKVNQKFCKGKQCKFLLAYYPPTMETSITNIEYLTYVKLAESLGRIMVLTNVGSTKISTCQRLPFNFYYDVNKLKENFPNVKFISQDEFQKWSYHRYEKPTTSHYYLTDGGRDNSVNHINPYSDSLKKIWCLDRFNLNLNKTTSFRQLRLSWNRNRLENFLVDNLQDNSDVLLIRHDTREPLFKNVPPLVYSKHIRDAASKMINSLKPYVAIHWDVAHTETSALSVCAPNLLSNVQQIVDKTSIENIYFASDYPLRHLDEINSLNSTKPFIQSSHKWRYISEYHTKAMKLISSTISYHTADSLGGMKYLKDALKDEFENSGVRDIFDKLILIEADWYVGLPNWPCNVLLDLKRSQMITEIRNQIWKNDLKVDKELGISRDVISF